MAHHRSFLKWAGGKYLSLSKILSVLPKGKRLIEPFTGSGTVFINTQFEAYLLADYNQDLIHLFKQIQQKDSDFIQYCQKFFTEDNNQAEIYYEFRKQFNTLSLDRLKEKSALFLYLNRHGYNGLCRYNQKGIYNVPFGSYKKPYFPQNELVNFQQKSQSVEFLQSDFRNVFNLAEPRDVIYCDPPYVPLTPTASFASYTASQFKEEDQIILAELAREYSAKGCTVIISNHDTKFTRKLYTKAKITSFPIKRYINCNPDKRSGVKELLALFK